VTQTVHHCGGHDHAAHASARDPVCGMTVDPQRTAHRQTVEGQTYYFCSAGCRTKFAADPDKYLKPAPPPAAPEGALYTCPMHPDVRQVGPGSCPICGMALEPVLPTADAGPHPELADMTRRFSIGLALTVPLFVLDMAGHVFDLHHFIGHASANFIEFAFATPVVLWAGAPFFVRGWQSVVRRNLNMFTLIALGTGVAFLYSTVATLAPGLFPSAFRGPDGAVAVYFEAAAVITVLVLLGQVLELRARAQTSGAIRALLDLAPKTARRVRPDGGDEEVPLDTVMVGDPLRVRPGEKIPVDGVVLEGRSSVDESLVTGESMPVSKQPGDSVIAGALNRSGSFVMRAEKVGRDTMLARIVAMVAAAQRSRAPIQRLADQVAGWFVPAVIFVALVAFAAWAMFGPEPRLAYGLVAAVTVLIIACPCALGLATPMSIMVGVGRGARAGVLIKNAEALERMEKVDTLVVDKTGTLTQGQPQVVAVVPVAGHREDELLRLAAGVERASEHPLAQAIVAAATARKLTIPRAAGFDAPAGRGVVGPVEGRRVTLGTAKFLAETKIATAALDANAERLRQDGATVVYVAIDGQAAGLVAIADRTRRPEGACRRRRTRRDAHRRQQNDRARGGASARDRRGRGGDAARTQGLGGGEVAPRRARGGDGRRRRQRRASARRRRHRHRHGHRHRRGDRKRGHHAGERRPRRHRRGAPALRRRHAQHSPEPAVRFHLQRGRRADRGWRALPGVRHSALAGDRRGRHGAFVG